MKPVPSASLAAPMGPHLFYSQQAGPAFARAHCRGGLFLYGLGTAYPAPHHEVINDRERAENKNGTIKADIPNGEDSFPRGGDHRLLFDVTRRHPAFRNADAGQPFPRIRGHRPLARNFGNSFDQHRYYSFGIGRGFLHDR